MTAKINTRTTLHQGKVFALLTENITLANGATTAMEFLHHPGAAAIVPLLSDTRVILIQQYRHALREYIWEIPAGTLDNRETALTCAQRELIEETGYSAQEWQKLGEITPAPGCSDEKIHLYLASNLIPAQQNLDQNEVLSVFEVEFAQAMEMIFRGEIQDGKTIAGLVLAFQRLKKPYRL
ncbi:MAG: NUDIX hydrolase [Desulfobacterales bacterium]|nr:MAG: NUDIX hydrolase [Desulfobacterales bacterium]